METPVTAKCNKMIAVNFRKWWTSHYEQILSIAIAFMVIIALARQGYEFWRLLFCTTHKGAIDLKIYHELIQGWFANRPIYDELSTAVHPPATYLILWPFLGWLSVSQARWLWAATAIAAIVWLSHLFIKQSGMRTRVERTFGLLFVISMYATAISVGNGQLILYIMPALLTAVLILNQKQIGWGREIFASLLLLMALVKPPISAPFFWIVLFVCRTMRPFIIVFLTYIGLTFLSTSFQENGFFTLVHSWLESSSSLAIRGGYANIHIWLRDLGMEWALFPCSVIAFILIGIWIYRHRDGDLWHLLGVTAIVARLWTYHRMYDDLLILFPLITLFRTLKSGSYTSGSDIIAGLLIAVSWIFMLAPGTLARVSWGWPFRFGQSFIWLVMLIFLIYQTSRLKKNPVPQCYGND